MMQFSKKKTYGLKIVSVLFVMSLAGAQSGISTLFAQRIDTREETKMLNAPTGNARYELNKSNVLAFYDLAFNQSRPAEAIRLYAGETYTQHNPEVADGKEAFIAYFEEAAKKYPGKKLVFKRVFADGAYVIVHSAHTFPGWRGGTWAAMDIFRLNESGKIVEHWDTLQKVPSSAANPNGVF